MEQEVELPSIFKLIFSVLVLIAGVALYIFWAASYNAWTDIGLYSVCIIVIGFGVAGIFLSTRKEVVEEE
ncbi:MAG: hypothetical protein JSW28_07690 [Thermoplasmata archaeon]|nr:MAG: hypothetical protein JSW28_07690 [Thermoplasmata archaeon]